MEVKVNLRIYNFNNYYNRKVKFLTENSTEYANYIYTIEKANFIPNDGITTSHNFGNAATAYDGTGDYVVVTDEYNKIVSRWFIMEAVRLTGGQWQLELKRDLLVDYHDIIKSAPSFIEKAILNDNDPFIYNTENMSFNQIKTKEYPIMDETECPWIVGYFDRNTEQPLSAVASKDFTYDLAVETSFSNWDYYRYTLNTARILTRPVTYILATSNNGPNASDSQSIFRGFEINKNGGYNFITTSSSQALRDKVTEITGYTGSKTFIYNFDDNITAVDVYDGFRNYGFERLETLLLTDNYLEFVKSADSNNILSLDNKVIRFTNSNGSYSYYKCALSRKGASNTYYNRYIASPQTTDTTLDKAFKEIINDIDDSSIPDWWMYTDHWGYHVGIYYNEIDIVMTPINITDLRVNFGDAVNRYKTKDAPYDIFAIPYPINTGSKTILNTGAIVPGTEQRWAGWTAYPEYGLRIAQALVEKYGGLDKPVIYDLQLLPYCPCRNIIKKDNDYDYVYNIDLEADTAAFVPVFDSSNNIISVVCFASESSFTLDIPVTYATFKNYGFYPKNIKLENQTDMYRLVSPNYNGQFEFSLTKTGGITKFNIDCTYKPFDPYIHLNPDFGNLYGQDFNDSRGLICGGDFSLPIMTSAWETYARSNKYYQNIFDRQIENLETTRDIERDKFNLTAAESIIKGGINGVTAAALTGNPYTIAASAAFGAGTAALKSGLQYNLTERAYQENIDYTKDLFGYNLGNIKALPASLVRTSALTYNNKYFPILEYYTCTNEEKTAFANKIAYNSMSVGRIDTIENYIYNAWSYGNITSKGYIKATPIYLDNIGEDYHIANEISNELNKGAYYG